MIKNSIVFSKLQVLTGPQFYFALNIQENLTYFLLKQRDIKNVHY